MKLNEKFVKHDIDGQTLLVPVGGAPFHGLVEGNKTVGMILSCLEQDTTEEEIVAVLSSHFKKSDEALIREDVADVLTRLKAIGAIDE